MKPPLRVKVSAWGSLVTARVGWGQPGGQGDAPGPSLVFADPGIPLIYSPAAEFALLSLPALLSSPLNLWETSIVVLRVHHKHSTPQESFWGRFHGTMCLCPTKHPSLSSQQISSHPLGFAVVSLSLMFGISQEFLAQIQTSQMGSPCTHGK